MKINLGCDTFPIEGFINVDGEPKVNPDVCMDFFDYLKSLKPNSVDEVYAGHVIEHFTTEESISLLKEVKRVLKVGGKVTVVVPDTLKGIYDLNAGAIDLDWLNQIVFGSQIRELQNHRQVFTSDILIQVLKQVFEKVYPVDIKDVAIAVSHVGWQSAAVCIK